MYDYWIENLTTMQVSIFNSSTIPLLLNICCLNLQEGNYKVTILPVLPAIDDFKSVLPMKLVDFLMNSSS